MHSRYQILIWKSFWKSYFPKLWTVLIGLLHKTPKECILIYWCPPEYLDCFTFAKALLWFLVVGHQPERKMYNEHMGRRLEINSSFE